MFKAELDFKKNPTQGNFILKFLKDNPNLENPSSKNIAALLPEFTAKPTKKQKNPMPKKIPESTVRARLSEFQKLNIVSNDNKQFSITQNWHKKLLKAGQTKNPKKDTKSYIEIYTFENNDIDRYESLMNAAINGLMGDLESIDLAGYTSDPISATEVDRLYITDFDIDNPDGSWGNLSVLKWDNKSQQGRVELFDI
jgi:hypothetical protein